MENHMFTLHLCNILLNFMHETTFYKSENVLYTFLFKYIKMTIYLYTFIITQFYNK